MKKQIAYLEYTFIFDPSETFQSGTKFEKFLSDFFGDHGYEAEVVETVGNTSRRVISITKVNETMEFDKKESPPKSLQQSMTAVHKNIPTGKKKR